MSAVFDAVRSAVGDSVSSAVKADGSSGGDTTNPTIQSSSPADNATDVATTTNPTITFDEPVAFGTGNITLRNVTDAVNTEVFDVTVNIGGGAGTVSISSATLTIEPTADLDEQKEYAIQIDATAIDDTSGNSFAGIADETTLSFTTADETAPAISSTSPTDDATDVAITVNPTITFDENIAFGTGNITLRDVTGASDVETFDVTTDIGGGAGTVSISGSTLTIEPTSDLSNSNEYAIQIDATAIDDTSGNSFAGIADETTFSFTTAAAFSVANQTYDFGDSTLSGAGAYTFSATTGTIASVNLTGTNAADFNASVTAGVVSITPASNNLTNGPYSLVCECYDGAGQTGNRSDSTQTITTVANELTVISDAEMDSAMAAVANGDTVKFRQGDYGDLTLATLTLTNVTLDAEAGSTFNKLDINGVTGLTLASGMDFVSPNSGDLSYVTNGTTNSLYIHSSSNIIVDGASFDCQHEDYLAGDSVVDKHDNYQLRWGGIRASGSTVEIKNCTIQNVRDGIIASDCTATIEDNTIHHIFEDGITGQDTDWIVNRNTIYHFQGKGFKTLTGATITGTIVRGDVLTSGSGSSTEVVTVHAVRAGSNEVDVIYNNHASPSSSGTLAKDGSNDVAYTGTTGDGIHGDAFQPFVGTASTSYQLTANDNHCYVEGALSNSVTTDENVFQGFLCSDTGGHGASGAKHSPVQITGNRICGGMPVSLSLTYGENGDVQHNTVIEHPIQGSTGRARIKNGTDLVVAHNAWDTIAQDDGGNTNVIFESNVDVDGTNRSTEFPSFAEGSMDTDAAWTPSAGNSVANGNAGAFTTGGALRADYPRILESKPADNATDVAVNTDPTVKFTRAMAFSSTALDVILRNVTDSVDEERFDVTVDTGGGAGTVSIASQTLTIEPTSDFGNSKNIAIQWEANALEDTDGNAHPGLTDTTTLDFTTVASASNPAVVGTAASSTGTNPMTYTAESGSNRMVVIFVSWEDTGSPRTASVTSLTFGGTACVKAVEGTATANNYNGLSLWYMKEADIPTGSQNISVTFDESAASFSISVVTLENCHQTTAPVVTDPTVEGEGVTAVDITTSDNNSMIIGATSDANAATLTADAPSTLEVTDTYGSAASALSSYLLATAGTQTIGFSGGGSSRVITAAAAFSPV